MTMPGDKWTEIADNIASWIDTDETVYVLYGEFEEIMTPRDGYESQDFKVATVSSINPAENEIPVYRMMNKYDFREFMTLARQLAMQNKNQFPKIIEYTRTGGRRSNRRGR